MLAGDMDSLVIDKQPPVIEAAAVPPASKTGPKLTVAEAIAAVRGELGLAAEMSSYELVFAARAELGLPEVSGARAAAAPAAAASASSAAAASAAAVLLLLLVLPGHRSRRADADEGEDRRIPPHRDVIVIGH